jgi:two-component system, NtrC family, response regulator HydG
MGLGAGETGGCPRSRKIFRNPMSPCRHESCITLESEIARSGMRKGRVLIVDDEATARSALGEILGDEGYKVRTASDGFRALATAEEFAPDVVITDMKMPGMDGLELLARLRNLDPEIAVVLVTAFGAVGPAVQAMRSGATDYLTKPLNSDELLVVLERAFESADLRRDARRMREQLADRVKFDNLVGESPEIQEVFKSVAQVAPTRATVLITGESGTGKELVASAIHHHSERASRPFVKLHCAALAESLLESELFGHERGAFTGAERRRMGRFEQADGGTLFLDEIGEIPSTTQVKLLRVLQEHEFERVGGNQPVKVDVRIVAATNRDLKSMVEQGKFREDLYYRLNVIRLELPPLRKRRSDILSLAYHFLEKYASANGRTLMRFDEKAARLLGRYDWPGNVRELENVIERAVVLAEGNLILPRHLPAEVQETLGDDSRVPRIPGSSLADIERYAILETLAFVGGSTTRASEMLGISVRKIQYRLHDYAEAPKGQMPALRESES